jgi:hypothetical protein
MHPTLSAYLAQELIRDRVSEAERLRRVRQARPSDAEVRPYDSITVQRPRRVRRFVRSLTAPIRS